MLFKYSLLFSSLATDSDRDPADSASDFVSSPATLNRYQKQYLDDDSEYERRDDELVAALRPKYKGVAANQNQRK
jgi:hypothetical protein